MRRRSKVMGIVSAILGALLVEATSHCSAGSTLSTSDGDGSPDGGARGDGSVDGRGDALAPSSPAPVYCGTQLVCGSGDHCVSGCCVQYRGSVGCFASAGDAGCFGEAPCDAGGLPGCAHEGCKPEPPKCAPGAPSPSDNAACNFSGSEAMQLECVCSK